MARRAADARRREPRGVENFVDALELADVREAEPEIEVLSVAELGAIAADALVSVAAKHDRAVMSRAIVQRARIREVEDRHRRKRGRDAAEHVERLQLRPDVER